VRRVVPLQFGGIDFSPMLLIFALFFVSNFLRTLLFR
jgi:YggT family protein